MFSDSRYIVTDNPVPDARARSWQVALSLWLLFALIAEAPSIAAQVLGAR